MTPQFTGAEMRLDAEASGRPPTPLAPRAALLRSSSETRLSGGMTGCAGSICGRSTYRICKRASAHIGCTAQLDARRKHCVILAKPDADTGSTLSHIAFPVSVPAQRPTCSSSIPTTFSMLCC